MPAGNVQSRAGPGPWLSGREPLTAFGPAAFDNPAASLGSHPGPEAVAPLTADAARLIGAFHGTASALGRIRSGGRKGRSGKRVKILPRRRSCQFPDGSGVNGLYSVVGFIYILLLLIRAGVRLGTDPNFRYMVVSYRRFCLWEHPRRSLGSGRWRAGDNRRLRWGRWKTPRSLHRLYRVVHGVLGTTPPPVRARPDGTLLG